MRLVFVVEVESDNEDADKTYLRKIQEIFRGITEGLAPYGFTDDESVCNSRLEYSNGPELRNTRFHMDENRFRVDT